MNISDYKSLYSQRQDCKSSRTVQIQPNVDWYLLYERE